MRSGTRSGLGGMGFAVALLAPLTRAEAGPTELPGGLAPPVVEPSPDEPGTPAERHARSLQAEVTRLRNLPFKDPVVIRTRTSGELRDRLLEDLAEEYPPSRVEAVQKAGVRLGFFPPGFDFHRTLSDLLTEQIAGFYDPKRKELCLVDRAAASGLEKLAEGLLEMMSGLQASDIYAIHELTHAAQDQHFDLETLPIEVRDEDDLVMAVKSVVEGDATYVMFDALARSMGQTVDSMSTRGMGAGAVPLGGAADRAPEYLKQSLVFPYFAGLHFIQQARRRGGWERVDALYADLPASTEQVLHPEKFLGPDRDLPQRLSWGELEALPGSAWMRLESNVLGEFGLRQWLKARGVRIGANRFAAGWDGDRYHVYQAKEGGRLLLLLATTWDSADEAAGFTDALSEPMDDAASGRIDGPAGWRGWRRANGEQFWLVPGGSDVLVIDGWTGGEVPERLVAEWRNGLRREEIRRVARVPRKPRKP